MRRVLAISSIGNQPHNLHGKYIAGSGVGASSVFARRLKQQRSTECYPIQNLTKLRVYDIATYDVNNGYWALNDNTTITPFQYLTIYIGEDLHIPYDKPLTNYGKIDNYGSFHTNTYGNYGATVFNMGTFNNYGTLQINSYCRFYTYNGGTIYNSTSIAPDPEANIVVDDDGIFAFPPAVGSTCETGTFTGKTTPLTYGVISVTCPP